MLVLRAVNGFSDGRCDGPEVSAPEDVKVQVKHSLARFRTAVHDQSVTAIDEAHLLGDPRGHDDHPANHRRVAVDEASR